MTDKPVTNFSDLSLSADVMKGLEVVGYESPSPIQAATIPIILSGKDVVGQAQTGTGKTAAFALPILSAIDIKQKDPQVMVLTPTRELAIQVAEAFQTYASQMKGFHVLPIYGGQDYRTQIRALTRGVHVVVGTPGRVMDHMRKGTLKLNGITHLVLDEADEMLRMGFIDDVEWILSEAPEKRQVALFSATMPQQIRRIAKNHLNEPEEVTIKVKTTTAETIRQRFWPVTAGNKLDTLTRILEAEAFDAMLVFVKTKIQTVELSEKLAARGYASSPLSGDIPQAQRERTVKNLKSGKLDILVATDVAARGLDVERISHVLNYDIPFDTEAYVHRIGRTGRAGRQGDAILFVAPREKRMLGAIEKATRQKIDMMDLPSNDIINQRRISKFKERISETLETEDLELFVRLIEEYQQEKDIPLQNIAAALAQLLQGSAPFLLTKKEPPRATQNWDNRSEGKGGRQDRNERSGRNARSSRNERPGKGKGKSGRSGKPHEEGMERYRIEVGHDHGVMPTNIVGAIANEAGIESRHIGRIDIYDDHSLIDLPDGMPSSIYKKLKDVWVSGQKMRISKADENKSRSHKERDKKPHRGKAGGEFASKSKTGKKSKAGPPKDHDKKVISKSNSK